MGAFGKVFRFVKVVASELGQQSKQVLLSIRGFSPGEEDDAKAEGGFQEEVYSALGVVSRPRDKDAKGHAEAITAITEDGMTPIAMRDLRLSKARGNIAKGATSLVGYGGAFVGVDDASSGTGSVVTIYAPYQHDDGGAPAKAHVVLVDTTDDNEGISLVHAEGHAILLTPGKQVLIKNADGSVFVAVDDKGVTISGTLKSTSGIIAGTASAAKSILIDPTESGAWFAAVMVALGQIAGLLNSPGAVSGAPGSVTLPVVPLPVASTVAKAAPSP